VSEQAPREILAVANETVAGKSLLDALKRSAREGSIRVTVLAPINHPREGYVVYEDTRRAAAGRRLDRTLELLREAGIPAHGLVVDADPVSAVRDAIAQLEPDAIVVSTHPETKSGWLRRDVVDRIRSAAGQVKVEHVVADMEREEGSEANVLVVANETVIGEPLLERIRERARRSPASFLIVSPQSDLSLATHPEAERRLRNALATLRSDGIEAHGQIAHPDPFTAAMQAISDERIDQIIVSTFPGERSGWLKRDVVGRLRKSTRIPVEHVVVEPAAVGAAT
jgi:hypothetical protein